MAKQREKWPETPGEVRALATGRLGQDLPEAVWRELVASELVAGVLRAGGLEDEEKTEALSDLLRLAKSYLRIASAKPTSGGPASPTVTQQPIAVSSPGDVRLRARAVSEYLAEYVSGRPEVVAFRQRYLPGRLITTTEATSLLQSPAAGLLPLDFFTERHIPLGAHTSEVLEEKSESTERASFIEGRVRVRWGDQSCVADFHCSIPIVEQGVSLRLVAWPGEAGVWREPAWPGSLLSDVARVGESLATYYPWEECDATWFLLTGVRPWVPPVRLTLQMRGNAEGYSNAAIVLTVSPWVPAAAVTKAYREAQRKVSQGERNYPISEKSIALFRFLLDLGVERRQDWPGWNAALSAWNEQHPDQRYDDVRTFSRDYSRAKSRIAR